MFLRQRVYCHAVARTLIDVDCNRVACVGKHRAALGAEMFEKSQDSAQ